MLTSTRPHAPQLWLEQFGQIDMQLDAACAAVSACCCSPVYMLLHAADPFSRHSKVGSECQHEPSSPLCESRPDKT
jgi:hypothetical protein